jgi:hypothetical protein
LLAVGSCARGEASVDQHVFVRAGLIKGRA